MQRRTVAAAVAAITMSLASGVIAFGANTGTLGLAGGHAASPAPVTAPAPTTAARTPAPTAPHATEGHGTATQETTGGEHDD